MKYKLINKQTGEKHICKKVKIDGFDYYVNDYISDEVDGDLIKIPFEKLILISVATNNPNIDVPKVVDEVEILANLYCKEMDRLAEFHDFNSFKYAYNKSQEAHPFSEEDMIDFAEWIADSKLHGYSKQLYEAMIRHKVSTTKELLQFWKEQRPKIVYYE